MSKENEYEETYDSNRAICPYCGHSYQVEAEDYDLDGMDEECESCGGTYERVTQIEVTHYCAPKAERQGDAPRTEALRLCKTKK